MSSESINTHILVSIMLHKIDGEYKEQCKLLTSEQSDIWTTCPFQHTLSYWNLDNLPHGVCLTLTCRGDMQTGESIWTWAQLHWPSPLSTLEWKQLYQLCLICIYSNCTWHSFKDLAAYGNMEIRHSFILLFSSSTRDSTQYVWVSTCSYNNIPIEFF